MHHLPGPGTELVSFIARQIPNYWTTREGPLPPCLESTSSPPALRFSSALHLFSPGQLWQSSDKKAQTPQPDTRVTAFPPVAFTPLMCPTHAGLISVLGVSRGGCWLYRDPVRDEIHAHSACSTALLPILQLSNLLNPILYLGFYPGSFF